MNDTHVEISVEFNGRQMDFRVPADVTMMRLAQLLHQVFDDNGVRTPRQWRLQLVGKPINVDDMDLIEDMPIGDGDIMRIVPIAEKTPTAPNAASTISSASMISSTSTISSASTSSANTDKDSNE